MVALKGKYSYILVVYNARDAYKVINRLKKNDKINILAVAIAIETEDPRILGGYKSKLGAEILRNVAFFRVPLPSSKRR